MRSTASANRRSLTTPPLAASPQCRSRLINQTIQTIKLFSWNYIAGSDLKSSLAYPNGITTTWTYDANNQLLQVCNATPTNVISQYDYTYDAAGRRINVSKTGTAFTQDDSIAYGYNEKSELTNAVASVDSNYRYSYDFDGIGNREASSERGTNSVYAANQLNQYTAVDDFIPQFDDDGNQTLIQTSTGIWQVQYNGENRPVLWRCVSTNSPTPNSSTPTLISMSYDRMGRRVTKYSTNGVRPSCPADLTSTRPIYVGVEACSYTEERLVSFEFDHFELDVKEPGFILVVR